MNDYQLLDTGDGEKLESFSDYKIVRPDPRVIWGKCQPKDLWEKADAVFARSADWRIADGRWIFKTKPPKPWQYYYKNLTFNLRPTDFRHVGVFPEQTVNWDWLENAIDHQPLKVLNLFAYTGGATMAATKAGAKVTHVDSSKSIISWARENCLSSGLASNAVRWIEDDAYKFVLREQRRASFYDGIILDPPRFGHGAKGEIWKLEDDLQKLVMACKNILSATPKFVLMSLYTADLSPIAIGQLFDTVFGPLGGKIEFSELTIKEASTNRLLPSGIVARWNLESHG